jgi:hypothetical protein
MKNRQETSYESQRVAAYKSATPPTSEMKLKARTILYKVIKARIAVIPWRLSGEPAKDRARLGRRGRVC